MATGFSLLSCLTLFLLAPVELKAAELRQGPDVKNTKLAANETAIFVGNLHCKTCAKKLASKLYAVKGVVRVRSNVKDNLTIVTCQKKKKLDINALWTAAQKAGFQPVKLINPQGTFIPDPKTKAAHQLPDRVTSARKQQ
ncbi:MAG: heavy metal transporter [Pirellulales bacterium]|nr:heavy metal transporter [Pirellulales bacterium]